MTYQLNDKAMIGVVYRPEFDAELEGDVNFSNFVNDRIDMASQRSNRSAI